MDKAAYIEAHERCVMCGKCKAVCPTYELALREPMGARGRVLVAKALEDGDLAPSDYLSDILNSCLLCGICESTCPAGVSVTEAVYHGRAGAAC